MLLVEGETKAQNWRRIPVTGPQNDSPGLFGSRGGLVLIGFAAIAGFYLWTEHRAHLFGILPFLFLLACPLMHLFMHGGHGGHGGHDHGSRPADRNDDRGSEKPL